MPLSILSNIAREAPLGSLLITFLLGAVARPFSDIAGRERTSMALADIDSQSLSIRQAVSRSVHPARAPKPSAAAGDGNSEQERD